MKQVIIFVISCIIGYILTDRIFKYILRKKAGKGGIRKIFNMATVKPHNWQQMCYGKQVSKNPFLCKGEPWYNQFEAQSQEQMKKMREEYFRRSDKNESDVQSYGYNAGTTQDFTSIQGVLVDYSGAREEKVINPTLELTESKDKEPE